MRFQLLYSIAAAAYLPGLEEAIDVVLGNSEILESPEQRLVEFESGDRQWVTEEELFDLLRSNKKFFDITLHPDTPMFVEKSVKFPKEVEHSKEVHKLAKVLSKENLESTLTEFSGFYTRYAKSEHGLNSSLWLYDQVAKLASARDDITVSLFDHEWQQKSLIASFKGTKRPEDIVVVGAHQDSINLILPSVLPAPGADDDGSGTVTTLEVFRNLVQSGFKPENTLEFHWYSAEELGLLGSQDVFASYAKKGYNVKAMLQQDMTGYSAGSTEDGQPDSLGVIVDYVDPGLTEFVKLVVTEYCDIPYVETKCGYACSDHASASKHGYPSAFVIEADFSKTDHFIHTTQDTIDRLDFDHMLQHAKLTLGYAYELSYAKL